MVAPNSAMAEPAKRSASSAPRTPDKTPPALGFPNRDPMTLGMGYYSNSYSTGGAAWEPRPPNRQRQRENVFAPRNEEL